MALWEPKDTSTHIGNLKGGLRAYGSSLAWQWRAATTRHTDLVGAWDADTRDGRDGSRIARNWADYAQQLVGGAAGGLYDDQHPADVGLPAVIADYTALLKEKEPVVAQQKADWDRADHDYRWALNRASYTQPPSLGLEQSRAALETRDRIQAEIRSRNLELENDFNNRVAGLAGRLAELVKSVAGRPPRPDLTITGAGSSVNVNLTKLYLVGGNYLTLADDIRAAVGNNADVGNNPPKEPRIGEQYTALLTALAARGTESAEEFELLGTGLQAIADEYDRNEKDVNDVFEKLDAAQAAKVAGK